MTISAQDDRLQQKWQRNNFLFSAGVFSTRVTAANNASGGALRSLRARLGRGPRVREPAKLYESETLFTKWFQLAAVGRRPASYIQVVCPVAAPKWYVLKVSKCWLFHVLTL